MSLNFNPQTPNDLRMKQRASSIIDQNRMSMENALNKSNGKLMKIIEQQNVTRKSKIFQSSQISQASTQKQKKAGPFEFVRTSQQLSNTNNSSSSFTCMKSKRNN